MNGDNLKTQKILFISGSLNRGGAQRVMTLLADEYVRLGWSVHMAVLLQNKIGYEISNQIVIHDVVRSGNQIKNVLKWVKDIKNILINEKPSVVVSFAGRINMITMLAARGTGIPVLVSERNDPVHDRRNKFEQWLCKRFYGKADKVVFQTRYQAQYYQKWCGNNSVVIGNPIAAPVYEGEHDKKDIVCIGKLMDQKNHPMMIRTFKMITDEFPDKQLYIYGEGAKRSELENLVKEYRLEQKVHLPGNSDHIFDIMHEYEYFVMCSDYEGLSNALLEAMISGMVCVSTAWNGVEDVVKDGENGYLVPLGDSKALAEKLRTILNVDNEKIREFAIETGKKFSSDQVMTKWCEAIEGLVKRRKQ